METLGKREVGVRASIVNRQNSNLIGVHPSPPKAGPWQDRRLDQFWRESHGDGEADCGEPAERAEPNADCGLRNAE